MIVHGASSVRCCFAVTKGRYPRSKVLFMPIAKEQVRNPLTSHRDPDSQMLRLARGEKPISVREVGAVRGPARCGPYG